MKIKTIILFAFGAITVSSCSPRSYVMSFKSVSSADPKYTAPESLSASTTTPAKVAAPQPKEQPKRATGDVVVKDIDPSLYEQVDAPASDDALHVDPKTSSASPFVGKESEHIKFASYNPFENGTFTVDLDAAAAEFTYPIAGKFSSGYGRRGRGTHTGVDLVAPALTPVYAAFDGVVRLSKPYSGYGNVIVVRHQNGLETVYAHNEKNLVKVGDNVTHGQKIAQCGRTGRATTNHLHFEVRIQGQSINPALLIDVQGRTLQSGKLTVARASSGSITAKLSSKKSSADEKLLAQNQPAAAKVENAPSTETKNSDANVGDAEVQSAPVSPRESKGIRVGDKVYDAPKAAAKSTSKPVDAPNATYHTIMRGDTLSGIAAKYSTTVAALCELNSITKNTVIKADKKIRVK